MSSEEDDFHPLRNHGDVAELNVGRDANRYRKYLHGQVRELLTRYGRIDYLFFDAVQRPDVAVPVVELFLAPGS